MQRQQSNRQFTDKNDANEGEDQDRRGDKKQEGQSNQLRDERKGTRADESGQIKSQIQSENVTGYPQTSIPNQQPISHHNLQNLSASQPSKVDQQKKAGPSNQPISTSNPKPQSQNPTTNPQQNPYLPPNPQPKPQTQTQQAQQQQSIEHLKLHANQAQIELSKRVCAECVHSGILANIEEKESAVSTQIATFEQQMWKLFSELMDADCLNSARPDQFLQMKNRINIKFVDQNGAEVTEQMSQMLDYKDRRMVKQLIESLSEIDPQVGSYITNKKVIELSQSSQAEAFQSAYGGLFRRESQANMLNNAQNRKKLSTSQANNQKDQASQNKRPSTKKEKEKELKVLTRRNEVLSSIEKDLLPTNRLQQEFQRHQINFLNSERQHVLDAKVDPSKIQMHHPGAIPHGRFLKNSYLSELDLETLSKNIDIEMAVNIQDFDEKSAVKTRQNNQKSNQSSPQQEMNEKLSEKQVDSQNDEEKNRHCFDLLDLNCDYDFRPSNYNYILLNRFAFASKRRRIQKFVQKRLQRRKNALKDSLLAVEAAELDNNERLESEFNREHKALEIGYPRLYREKIESKLKTENDLKEMGLDLGTTEKAKFSLNLHPLTPNLIETEQKLWKQHAPQIPDEILRAKASYTPIPRPRLNIYAAKCQGSGNLNKIDLETTIIHEPKFKLIEDPIEYEMHYKKANVWSFDDIRTFVIELLREATIDGRKRFEAVGEFLPHKTAKEMVFFYHTLKKLLKLKQEMKSAQEQVKARLSSSQSIDVSFQKQADTILEPLYQHMKRNKIEIGAQGDQNGINLFGGGLFGSGIFGTQEKPNTMSKSQSKDAEKRKSQKQFNIEELLQIFSASNFQNGNRRRPKAFMYANLPQHLFEQTGTNMGMYPHKTFKVPESNLGCPEIDLDKPQYFQHLKAQLRAETDFSNQNSTRQLVDPKNMSYQEDKNLDSLFKKKSINSFDNLENRGRSLLEKMQKNQKLTQDLTKKIREKIVKSEPRFQQDMHGQSKHDSWNQTHLKMPHQYQLKMLLNHNQDWLRSNSQDSEEIKLEIREKTQKRQLDLHEVFELQVSSNQQKEGKPSKKGSKAQDSFVNKYFEDKQKSAMTKKEEDKKECSHSQKNSSSTHQQGGAVNNQSSTLAQTNQKSDANRIKSGGSTTGGQNSQKTKKGIENKASDLAVGQHNLKHSMSMPQKMMEQVEFGVQQSFQQHQPQNFHQHAAQAFYTPSQHTIFQSNQGLGGQQVFQKHSSLQHPNQNQTLNQHVFGQNMWKSRVQQAVRDNPEQNQQIFPPQSSQHMPAVGNFNQQSYQEIDNSFGHIQENQGQNTPFQHHQTYNQAPQQNSLENQSNQSRQFAVQQFKVLPGRLQPLQQMQRNMVPGSQMQLQQASQNAQQNSQTFALNGTTSIQSQRLNVGNKKEGIEKTKIVTQKSQKPTKQPVEKDKTLVGSSSLASNKEQPRNLIARRHSQDDESKNRRSLGQNQQEASFKHKETLKSVIEISDNNLNSTFDMANLKAEVQQKAGPKSSISQEQHFQQLQEGVNTNLAHQSSNNPIESGSQRPPNKLLVPKLSDNGGSVTPSLPPHSKTHKNNLNAEKVSDKSQSVSVSQSQQRVLSWVPDEKKRFIHALKKYGRNYEALSRYVKNRTPEQCRNFFQNYKTKLNLLKYLPKGNQTTSNSANITKSVSNNKPSNQIGGNQSKESQMTHGTKNTPKQSGEEQKGVAISEQERNLKRMKKSE